MISDRVLFAFFPYLVTERRVRIRGIELRNCKDIADLPADAQEHLTTLSAMFFVDDTFRIENMTCAYLELPSDRNEADEWRRRLHEAHLLIGFLYSHPHPSGSVFLPFENSTLFVFRVGEAHGPEGVVIKSLVWHTGFDCNRVQHVGENDIPSGDYIPGYSGTRNQTTPLWVAKGCRIFPELPHITLNHTQELSSDVESLLSRPYQWAMQPLYLHPGGYPPDLRARVFTSLDWYMKGCRESIVEAESLVHLAIASESLLRLRSGEGVTDRFKDAVLTLLGPVPRLETWLDQFYAARSKAVHEGIASDLNFYPLEKEVLKKRRSQGESIMPHRSLLEYGRRIFRLCLASVLAGATQVRMSGLDSMFIPNIERIETICKKLNENLPSEKRIFSIDSEVAELCNQVPNFIDPDAVKVKDAIGAAKLALETYKDAFPQSQIVIDAEIEKVLSLMAGKPSSAMLERIDECVRQWQSTKVDCHEPHDAALARIVIPLLGYVSQPKFKLQCYFREKPKATRGDSDK